MRMRAEFGAHYEDEAFAHPFPTRGQPAEAPWRLAAGHLLLETLLARFRDRGSPEGRGRQRIERKS